MEKIELQHKAIRLYQQGLSTISVGKQLSKSPQTISNWLNKHNVKLRPLRKHSLDITKFDLLDSDIKCYWLGFILTDGYLCKKDGRIDLRLSAKDKDHVQLFANFIGSTIKVRYIQSTNAWYWSVKCKYLCERLLSISPKDIPNKYRVAFLCGVFDANGYCGVSHNKRHKNLNWDFSICIRSSWIEYIIKIIESYDLSVNIRNLKGIDEIRFGGRLKVKKILNIMNSYKGIRLKRKLKKQIDLLRKEVPSGK